MGSDLHIRFVDGEQDYDEIELIDRLSHEKPWCGADILDFNYAASSNVIVAVKFGHIIAYAAIKRIRGRMRLSRFAVDSTYRFQYVGTELMAAIVCLAMDEGIDEILVELGASNVAGRMFLTGIGFVMHRYVKNSTAVRYRYAVPTGRPS